jgi:hypothetical protein
LSGYLPPVDFKFEYVGRALNVLVIRRRVLEAHQREMPIAKSDLLLNFRGSKDPGITDLTNGGISRTGKNFSFAIGSQGD